MGFDMEMPALSQPFGLAPEGRARAGSAEDAAAAAAADAFFGRAARARLGSVGSFGSARESDDDEALDGGAGARGRAGSDASYRRPSGNLARWVCFAMYFTRTAPAV